MTIQDSTKPSIKRGGEEINLQSSKRVLCVEDCRLTRRIYKCLLQQLQSVEPFFAHNQKQALDMIAKDNYDFIITDYSLGDGNSDVVIKKIRSISLEVPILLVTTYPKTSKEVSELEEFNILHHKKPLSKNVLYNFLDVFSKEKNQIV